MLVTQDEAATNVVASVGEDFSPVSAANIAEMPEVSSAEVSSASEVADENPASSAKDLVATAEQIDWQQAAREAVAQAVNLPPAVRAAFTRSLDDATAAVRDALGRPMIPVVDAVNYLSLALPAHWLQDPAALQRLAHPSGDGFFDGSEGLSDERAAQIAQQQLASTGFLRKEA